MSTFSCHPDIVSAVSEGSCPDCHRRLLPVEVDHVNGSSVVRWGWCFTQNMLWRLDETPEIGAMAIGRPMNEVTDRGGHMRTLAAAELWAMEPTP